MFTLAQAFRAHVTALKLVLARLAAATGVEVLELVLEAAALIISACNLSYSCIVVSHWSALSLALIAAVSDMLSGCCRYQQCTHMTTLCSY
jgi:hypothetical protein